MLITVAVNESKIKYLLWKAMDESISNPVKCSSIVPATMTFKVVFKDTKNLSEAYLSNWNKRKTKLLRFFLVFLFKIHAKHVTLAALTQNSCLESHNRPGGQEVKTGFPWMHMKYFPQSLGWAT